MTTCTSSMAKSTFQIYFTQVENSMREMEMPPISTPLVGVMPLISAQAPLSTHTITSGARPRLYVSGPMIGMDTVARPDEDGMRKESSKYTR